MPFEKQCIYEGYSSYFIKSRTCTSEKPNGFSWMIKLVAKLWKGPPQSTFFPCSSHGTYDEMLQVWSIWGRFKTSENWSKTKKTKNDQPDITEHIIITRDSQTIQYKKKKKSRESMICWENLRPYCLRNENNAPENYKNRLTFRRHIRVIATLI